MAAAAVIAITSCGGSAETIHGRLSVYAAVLEGRLVVDKAVGCVGWAAIR
jgi:hypothetical protein